MTTHLVTQHLEHVAAELLEDHHYQQMIRDHIKHKHGVYALYDGSTLYYVGLASNMSQRLRQHLKDRHQGLWDRFSIYITRTDRHMRELEALLLRIVKPDGNRQVGKLKGSNNLKTQLARELREHHRNVVKNLVGSRAQKTTKEPNGIKNNTHREEATLSQYVSKSFMMRSEYNGYDVYRARVLKSGWIKYNGYHYSSPSTPASEIRGGNTNGWQFWKYRNQEGNWVPLGKLRK